MSCGKIIVLDGLDGSGKSTQFELASEKLECRSISFPDYDSPSSSLVKMYLAGDFSQSADGVSAYAASSFYAVDRYASFKLCWESDYRAGQLILASRYVSSNLIHQMVKLPKSKWNSFMDWLEDYEYEKLGLPRANGVVFLDMPVDISQRLLEARYNGDSTRKDIHESNVTYLHKCRESALYAADRLGWTVIPCSAGDSPLSREDIHSSVMEKINECLNSGI